MSGYRSFASFYDRLTQNIDYPKRAAYYDSLIIQHGGKRGILLDLGCGTGSLTMEFAALGYDVLGIDASHEMLSVAVSKPHDGITYLCQDMRALDLYGTVDVTVCALDGINHMTEEDGLRRAFARVSLFTSPGGLFLFDVNTPYKHEHVLGDNTFVYDLDDLYCVWQNAFDAKSCTVAISLDIFESSGKAYIRHEDAFSERAYTQDTLTKLLDQAGFSVLACYGLDSLEAPAEQAEKIVYVAVKREQS